MTDYDFPFRWSELKREWKRKKASLRSSRGWSTVESKCKLVFFFISSVSVKAICSLVIFILRNDEKTAADYKIQGGSVLHLVLALRGGDVQRHPKPALQSRTCRLWCLQPSVAVSLVWDRTTLCARGRSGSICGRNLPTIKLQNLQIILLW